MMVLRTRSLKWRLVRRLVALQAVMLAGIVLLFFGTVVGASCSFREASCFVESDDTNVDALQTAVTRDADGKLTLRPTAELAKLRADEPRLWFVIRDRQGQVLSQGPVPPGFARIGDALEDIDRAHLGSQLGDQRTTARVRRVDTAAGNVQILTGTGNRLPLRKAITEGALLLLTVALPSLAVMALATLIATPIVVRRSLQGLSEAAAQAERIDVDQRGTRLPLANLPSEVASLVKAVNDALGRLDEGYERHQRFLGNAAHELRTPIAILNTRLESLPRNPDIQRLIEDVARLSTLAEQLLDLQRLDQDQHLGPMACVDLVALARRVTADLAPLAIAAGYELSFDAEIDEVHVMGDRLALERALTNLVQNAIEHGGRDGTIAITVERAGVVQVVDEGAGIPIEHRERIFEPFYRMRPLDRGAGLGLNLVREIARLHQGRVSVVDGPRRGACFRMILPRMWPAS
jgi:signal transduction histidine kinase